MSEKTLPAFDFDESPEAEESEIKIFVGVEHSGENFVYGNPVIQDLTAILAIARAQITLAGFKEFGALKDAINAERKQSARKSNYKSAVDSELVFTLVNCTPTNYKMADKLDGLTLDIIELDEANYILKVWSCLTVSRSEKDDNGKANEISFKLTGTSFEPKARVVHNLLTGENSAGIVVTNKPIITQLVINDGSIFSGTGTVTLNNSCIGLPSHYRASRYSDFRDTNWRIYETKPLFKLYSVGLNRIYFQVKNSVAESDIIWREIGWHGMQAAEISESVIVGNINITENVTITKNTPCKNITVNESVEIENVTVTDEVTIIKET